MSVRFQVGNEEILRKIAPTSLGSFSVTNASANQNINGPVGATIQGWKLLEDASVGVAHGCEETNAVTIVSNQLRSVTICLQIFGRFRGQVYVSSGLLGANRAGVTFNIGVISAAGFTNGAGVVSNISMTLVDTSWYILNFIGQQNGGDTTSRICVRLADNSGNLTYDGDGVSGVLFY